MKQINTYIIEKLHINKDTKINNKKYERPIDLIRAISQKYFNRDRLHYNVDNRTNNTWIVIEIYQMLSKLNDKKVTSMVKEICDNLYSEFSIVANSDDSYDNSKTPMHYNVNIYL